MGQQGQHPRYTGCGAVFNANGLSYFGSLSGANQHVVDVDDWSADGTVAALAGMNMSQTQQWPNIGATELQLYEPQYLALKGTVSLPSIATPGGAAASDGRYVFHDAAGTSTFAIVHGNDPQSSVDVFAVAKLQ